jgi:hypothetical protein
LQVIKQEQGDNAPAEGVCDRTCVDGTSTVIECACDANCTPTTAACYIGARIAVPHSDTDTAADRFSSRVANRITEAHDA